MPAKVTTTSAGAVDYGSHIVGPILFVHQMALVLTGFTTAEIDSLGYLKPGVPVEADGTLVNTTSQTIFGVTIEAIKVANGNAAGDISGAGTQQITVMTIGQVNKKIIEDNLGRVLSANELSAFAIGGCKIALLS
jgi:hypothetical protein